MKKLIAALLLAFLGALFAPSAALADGPQLNQFCKKTDVGKIVGSLRCEKDGDHYRWKTYVAPSQTVSGSKSASTSSSASASASSSASATPSKSASATPSTSTTPAAAVGAQLPLTGSSPWLIAWLVVGGLLMAGAGFAIYRGTRPRTRFTA